ncbi:hypothetical protein LP419_13650 [Massilia sp. H-1]|nr:hypothetical protein LP419_13650 [Massilia sp. H-1]
MALVQGLMLAADGPSAWLLFLPLALCVPVTSLVQSGAGLAFPAALAGRANSAYNLALFLGAFTWQWGFGVLVDALKVAGAAPAHAFRLALAVTVALQLAALAYFIFSRAQPTKYAINAIFVSARARDDRRASSCYRFVMNHTVRKFLC